MNSTNWNFNEFLAFLLIYASHADFDFSEAEKKQIQNTVSNEVFEIIYPKFNALTDYQALELILSYREKFFNTKQEKERLLIEMKKIFHADGEFSVSEKVLYDFLKKLM